MPWTMSKGNGLAARFEANFERNKPGGKKGGEKRRKKKGKDTDVHNWYICSNQDGKEEIASSFGFRWP